MALLLARSRRRSLANPSLLHLFSTSSNDPNNDNASTNGNHSANNPPSDSSYFGDVKTDQPQQRPRNSTNPSTPNSKPMSESASLLETRKNLSEFRRRSAMPSLAEPIPTLSQSQPRISSQELYIGMNALTEKGESNESPDGFGTSENRAMEALRNSMRHVKDGFGTSGNRATEPLRNSVRAIEEKEADVQIHGIKFSDLRDGLYTLKMFEEKKQKK